MLCHVRYCFPVFVIIALCQELKGSMVTITPDTNEIIKNEEDLLEITCTGLEKLQFNFPITNKYRTTSEEEINQYPNNGMYISTFRRAKTVYGDTGWYGCADHEILGTPDSHYDPDIRWIYVYVISETNVFVESVEQFYAFHKVVSENVVIPCKPTSPHLNVTLYKVDDPVELGSKITYDPRIGFTIRNLTLKDSAIWKCVIEKNEVRYDVSYHLHVSRKQDLPEPRIITENLRHVTRGQTLRINCTFEYKKGLNFAFNWSTPQQSSRITIQNVSEEYINRFLKATSVLMIRDVMYEDAGEYECIVKSFHGVKTVKTNITVHDPQNKYLNLKPQNNDTYNKMREGQRVQWVVEIDAYPPPHTIRWLNPQDKEITASWKDAENSRYAINTTPDSTILRINRLNIENMGKYTVLAENEYGKKTIEFTLHVLAKPCVSIKRKDEVEEPYYSPNQLAERTCAVMAFPAPNITWLFEKCPNYPSDINSTTTTLTNTTVITENLWIFFSKVNMTVDVSGRIFCKACNEFGCDISEEEVLISDVKDGFGIIRPKGPITVGDDLELICGASIYNYSGVTWTENWNKPLERSNRLKIIEDKTQFTHRSILKINNVQKSDSTLYTCIGRTYNDTRPERDDDYKLEVDDESVPIFKTTNLNDTEIVFNVNTGDPKIIALWCLVDGRPIPTVTWFKDNIVLSNNSRYSIYDNNQKFRIKYLHEDDTGKYMCRAENRIGKREAYQQITVKGKELPKGLIALIAILFIIVIILIVYFTIKMRREKIMRKELMEAGLMHFEEGALECLNPDLTVDDQAELLPYDKKWEFPRERLRLGKQLGSGAFGVVMKAEAQGICEDEAVTTVAVKMVRRTTDPTYVRALASELKIMVHLGKHLNVVNLLGACTKNISKRELLVIVEYCRFGNLHNYLLRHRADFIDQIDPATGKFDPMIGADLLTRTVSMSSNNRIKYAALSFSRSLSANSGTDSVQYCPGTATDSQSPDSCVFSNNSSQPGWRSNYRGDYKDQNLKPICTQDLLSWAFQVARGMEYLSQRRVLHGDLAARNILLAESNVVKICDFGLAKTMYKDNNYKKKGDGPLPIKWMAIESIRDRVFSTQSDIWSFGIVLWEFFTLAETPYPGMEAEKQYQKLIEGYRMEKPEYSTAEVYDIMLQCWKAKPTLRPSFTELVESIGDLLEESVRTHYVSLNAPYMDMNTMMLENGKNDYLTMMSAPDHTALSSPTHEYVNSPVSETTPDSAYLCMSPSGQQESGIFSPRPLQEKSHFEFPSPTSDSEDAVELSPMLKKDEDPYLKPINVHERRAEFARQRQAMKNQMERSPERDSGYCNTPRNLQLIDLNEKSAEDEKTDEKNDSKDKDFVPPIIRTQDNYVNMPKQKSDFRKDMPDGFSNPSYVMMGNREMNQMQV